MSQPSMKVMEIVANGDANLFSAMMEDEGLRIVGVLNDDPLDTQVQTESVVAIASTLTEDVYDQVEMTRRQRNLKRLAESRGYVVALEEGLDQHPGTEYDPIKGKLKHPEEDPAPPPAPEQGAEGAAPPPQQ